MTTYSIQNGRQKVLVAVPTVLTFLALLLTGIRLYARRIQRMRALLDDYLCVLACVFAIGLLACNVAMVLEGGNGLSLPELHSPDDFLLWYRLSFATYLLWVANIAIVQMAILAFYQRMFWVVDWFRRTCYVTMALVIAWFVGLYIIEFVICKPVAKVWNSSINGTCGKLDKMCDALGLTHAFLDFSVLFILVPLIWNMKLSITKKACITILLLAGIFASVPSLLRLQCLFDLSGLDPNDPIKSMWLPWVYYFTELPIAIICCSAPSIPSVAKRIMSSPLVKSARISGLSQAHQGPSKSLIDSSKISQDATAGVHSKRRQDNLELRTYDFVNNAQ